MTEDHVKAVALELTYLKERLNELRTEETMLAERVSYLEREISTLEGQVKSHATKFQNLDSSWTWFVRLVFGLLIAGITAFLLGGGFTP